ncbi:MAG: hypothetical protein KIT79_07005 [Deltaproteobacteria bacterium]|nr:hypothetical protein [Deltaproteobacteria bacterium]
MEWLDILAAAALEPWQTGSGQSAYRRLRTVLASRCPGDPDTAAPSTAGELIALYAAAVHPGRLAELAGELNPCPT